MYTPWTPEEDAILLRIGKPGPASKVLPKSRHACYERLRRLRRADGSELKRYWSPEEDAVLRLPLSHSECARRLGRSRPACRDRRKKIGGGRAEPEPQEDFVAVLRRFEREPASVSVRDRQPLTYNPSGYQGSGCSSSANMD
jgi:hypothetical protein